MAAVDRIARLLDRDVPPIWQKLDRRERDAVAHEFLHRRAPRLPAREDDPARFEQMELVRHLRERVGELAARHGQLTVAFHAYQQRLNLAETTRVRRALMLEFLGSLGASARQLRADRKAMGRWLDEDAVSERHDRERARIERRLRFCIDRLGPLAAELGASLPTVADVPIWTALDLEASLRPLLAFPGEPRIRAAALRCLRTAYSGICRGSPAQVSNATRQYLYRTALDPQQSVWFRAEALEAVSVLAPGSIPELARQCIGQTAAGGDGMFLRRRLVELFAGLSSASDAHDILQLLARDETPFVRAGVAARLATLPPAPGYRLWLALVEDPEPAVAGQAWLQAPALVAHPDLQAGVVARLQQGLQFSSAAFPLRVALHVVPMVMGILRTSDAAAALEVHAVLERLLTALHLGHPDTAMRRRAAVARMLLQPPRLEPRLAELPLQASTRVPLPADPKAYARGLLPLVQRGFGFNLDPARSGLRVLRDWRWKPRFWRILHECLRPATDKRQSYSHVRGRVYPGLLHVPSQCLAELSPTKVPGEPLHIAEEDGWRPWLPLLDQVLSALDQDWPTRPLEIVTSEGITTIEVPHTLAGRLRAKAQLSLHFADIASLRNWTADSAFPAHAFVDALRACGIDCRLHPHANVQGEPFPEDPRIRRFFASAALPGWPAVSNAMQGLGDALFSIHQNTLQQLLAFVGVMGAAFFGQHVWLNRQFRRARARLPLVMGGWGTRGKSGTERLKAAVMNGLGLRVLSKTTGCEAMFLFSEPNRPLSEMFLFRPYDKATIWEQARLTRMAAALETDVMLWECMGLNPGYVRVLQHDWMRDDVSTITNCFPDHEDIQGPAGVDLPVVIGEFIPSRGVLYTSEENMLPFLEERARQLDTPVTPIGWLETGLLTPDILARFPYQEHPANIALVARMFVGMGVPEDFALKEMADRVVPDLGVLKIFPEATFEGRRIAFINGMSANERHGCLSNWARTGMAAHQLDVDPGIWTVTVVNNRADRVARSQVFAAILVNDIGADRHYLVGDNLDGLQRFVREAFDSFLSAFDWSGKAEDMTARSAMLDGVLRRWRVPLDDAQADARLRAMALASGVALPADSLPDAADAWQAAVAAATRPDLRGHAAALHRQWRQDRDEAAQVAELHRLVHAGGASDRINALLWELFSARIVVIPDYHTPGNVLVRRILLDAPPGSRIRAMGIQNIKGTGLDFVYRWQAWETHAALCRLLDSAQPEDALEAAKGLAASTELGVLEKEALHAVMARVRAGRLGQSDLMQSLFARIDGNLEDGLASVDAHAGQRPAQGNVARAWLTRTAERLLDAGDAVRRRRRANQIYADLVGGRIASTRAAYELKRINQRQKGGWLG